MDNAAKAGVPVVVVRHTGQPGSGMFEPDSAGMGAATGGRRAPVRRTDRQAAAGQLHRHPLQEFLAERSLDHITIVGYMTNVCCDTTARQALHMGLGASMLYDAVGVPAMPAIDGDADRPRAAPARCAGATGPDGRDDVVDESLARDRQRHVTPGWTAQPESEFPIGGTWTMR